MIAGDQRRAREPCTRRATGLVAAVLLAVALAGCGGGGPDGAAAPARAAAAPPGTATGTAMDGSAAAAGPASGRPGGGPSTSPPASDAPAAAAGVVSAYFAEVNAASRAGRIASVAGLALPGCQACALDVGVTRDLQQRSLHTDADPYAISGATAQPRQGLACVVTFLAQTRAVSLLDPAGRAAGTSAAVPARDGTAELALTRAGWRVQTIRYARRQP
jgi:hypothetical protein